MPIAPTGMRTTPPVVTILYPTCFFRWVIRDHVDHVAPSRVLQQWWTAHAREVADCIGPLSSNGGEWQDVPVGLENL